VNNTELSDEQLGRKWCERNGKGPEHYPRPGVPPWRWAYDDGPAYGLPACLWDCLPRKRHDTEASAYAAVGQALRELHRRAGEIAAVLGGVL
jgi:hypothetical protein